MAKFKAPSKAVLAGSGRRSTTDARRNVDIQWFTKKVTDTINLTMKSRVKLATEFIKDKVVRNISRPVTKGSGGRVTDRSKPGEFPKAETTQLLKTIFGDVITVKPGMYDGFIGTPLDYGLILETRMNRSFLKRTFEENRALVIRMLSGPIK